MKVERGKENEATSISYLHGRDVSVGDVSVHILDLGKVFLCYLDQLWPPRLLRQLGGALLLGGRVLIVVPVLLKQETHKEQNVCSEGVNALSTD